ncbi:MAG TPA: DUF1489 family protein [Rhodospirillales bacterium]|jgi:hypothetical protein|nr:DUF1489 family protein [Rhodospirillales bacterium]
MTVHLLKLSVGVEDGAELARAQVGRVQKAMERGDGPVLCYLTRNRPRRAVELLAGSSIFWVIKGFIRRRQRIIGIGQGQRDDGRPACVLTLDTELIKTELHACKPFQGWRYLMGKDAPADAAMGGGAVDELPGEMAGELRDMGLL